MSEVPELPPFWDGGPPPLDPAQVRPSVQDVADLEAVRRYDSFGNELDSFTDETRPSDVQVERLIDDSMDEILPQLPPCIEPFWFPAISRLVALRTASAVELSYFKEQAVAAAGPTSRTAQYQDVLDGLQAAIPKATYIG